MFKLQSQALNRGDQTVFQALSLAIEEGERVALLGASGAGKSTLLSALRQQREPLCAWCPQETSLVPMLSVFHNIYMGALQRHSSLTNLRNLVWPSRRERERVGEIAQALELDDKLFTSIDRLSGGQAQRAALGRALYAQRPVLLADEPVSNLDAHQGLRLLQLALSRHGTAVVAMHDRTLALQCFQRILGVHQGELVMDAPASRLGINDLDELYQT